ncbi:MAG: nuclear transport factor 2 family protein [Vicinamibacteria bacterium]|nr:nuclear transport factor 2 family protein [Vicinamibacteria bacterium]
MTTRILTIAALALLLPLADAAAQTASDKDAVRQAALDYVDGIYTVDTTRIERSVHENLTKRGFWREPTDSAYRPESVMTFDQLMKLTSVWNKDGKRDTSIKEITVLDVLDQTASAKIVAMWGIDYMHLAKYDGRWQIINIVWQAHPPRAQATASR